MPPAVLFSGLTIDLDITYIVVLTLFFVPLAVLNGLVMGPFKRLFAERHERLKGAVERAEERLEEAEEKAETFKEKIRIANAKGVEARNKIRAEAQKETNERIEAERALLDEKLGSALAEIARERDSALTTVKTESRRLGELTASRLLGRQV